MNNYTREQLLVLAKLTAEDLEEVERRRRGEGARLGNLGLAYRNLGQVQEAIDYHEQAWPLRGKPATGAGRAIGW